MTEETLREIMKRKSGIKEATGFRHSKIKEVFSKENPTETEIEFVNRWIEIFGDEL